MESFFILLTVVFLIYSCATKEGFESSLPTSDIKNALRMWSQGGKVKSSNGRSYTFEDARLVNNHPFFDELVPGNVLPISQEEIKQFLDGTSSKEMEYQLGVLADLFINKQSENQLTKILKDIAIM